MLEGGLVDFAAETLLPTCSHELLFTPFPYPDNVQGIDPPYFPSRGTMPLMQMVAKQRWPVCGILLLTTIFILGAHLATCPSHGHSAPREVVARMTRCLGPSAHQGGVHVPGLVPSYSWQSRHLPRLQKRAPGLLADLPLSVATPGRPLADPRARPVQG